jgi:hypothetical protein
MEKTSCAKVSLQSHSPFSTSHKGVSHFLHGEAIILAPLFPHSPFSILPFSILRGGVTTPNEKPGRSQHVIRCANLEALGCTWCPKTLNPGGAGPLANLIAQRMYVSVVSFGANELMRSGSRGVSCHKGEFSTTRTEACDYCRGRACLDWVDHSSSRE